MNKAGDFVIEITDNYSTLFRAKMKLVTLKPAVLQAHKGNFHGNGIRKTYHIHVNVWKILLQLLNHVHNKQTKYGTAIKFQSIINSSMTQTSVTGLNI